MAPSTVIPGVILNAPGFATHPCTMTSPDAGTRMASPGRAGRFNNSLLRAFARSINTGGYPPRGRRMLMPADVSVAVPAFIGIAFVAWAELIGSLSADLG